MLTLRLEMRIYISRKQAMDRYNLKLRPLTLKANNHILTADILSLLAILEVIIYIYIYIYVLM